MGDMAPLPAPAGAEASVAAVRPAGCARRKPRCPARWGEPAQRPGDPAEAAGEAAPVEGSRRRHARSRRISAPAALSEWPQSRTRLRGARSFRRRPGLSRDRMGGRSAGRQHDRATPPRVLTRSPAGFVSATSLCFSGLLVRSARRTSSEPHGQGTRCRQRTGPPEQPALPEGDAELAHHFGLGLGLDAFGDHLRAHRAGQVHQGR